MTAKELRDLCIEKLPMIQGVSSMSKEEIISTIKEMFGLETEPTAAEVNKGKILELKSTMRDLKAQRDQTEDPAQRDRLRKRISKLKKQTRRLAKSA
nr:hypothetical protein [Desulfohalovibrio reitneri]